MKNLLKLTLVVLLVLACKESKETKIIEGLMNEVTGKNEDINEKYNVLMKDLATKTLLTNEQLVEAFPKKLGRLSLDSDEGRITSSNTVKGSFGNGTIRIEILDAAGANAMGAIIPLKMLEINNITSENNNTIRYSKKERSGILTFGTDRDTSVGADYEAELRFLYDNRFYVTLEGKEMDVDALWNHFGVENLKTFKDFNK